MFKLHRSGLLLVLCLVASQVTSPTLYAQGPSVDIWANPPRVLLAEEGKGYLEEVEGNLVLHLEGSPYEMGYQHGVLLKNHVRRNVRNILYGVGVVSSIESGKWFLDEIQSAYERLKPHIPKEYIEEMDGLADGAGIKREEIRLTNVFPELFHCSGIALFGKATEGGKLYHGRILDYMTGVGLDKHAVVVVYKPVGKHPWVNVSYAGFVGSVTAMNDGHIAVGEMGGRGEGEWDGMPMSLLVRKVAEEAESLKEALRIMRTTPRTCEYYYVISDGNGPDAIGIYTTPKVFQTVAPGQYHPQLPTPIDDTVLFSGSDRYKALVERVEKGYGRIDAAAMIEVMKRPVAMKSNLHNVLFAPESLDFWVANAKGLEPACNRKYTHYNLGVLLNERPVK